MGALVITHYKRILNYIKPDFVHVFVDGTDRRGGRPRARREARGLRVRAVGETEGRGTPDGTDRDRDRPGDRRPTTAKYGFSNPDEAEDYFFKSGRGLSHELVDAISAHKNEPDWMRKFRHKSLDYFLARPMPTWGGDAVAGRDRLREHLLLHQADRESGRLVGGPARRHQGHLGQARHPRGREELPRRRRRPVRVRGRLPQAPGEPDRAGRDLPRHGHGAPRARGARSSSTSGRSSRRTTTSSPR